MPAALVTGRTTALENLDDNHATAAAWTRRIAGIDHGAGGFTLRFCGGEQLAGACDIAGASGFSDRP
jgi:secreted trypsin-like serine protease